MYIFQYLYQKHCSQTDARTYSRKRPASRYAERGCSRRRGYGREENASHCEIIVSRGHQGGDWIMSDLDQQYHFTWLS